jgi:APA family basic amino acid/polyamine antiporter
MTGAKLIGAERPLQRSLGSFQYLTIGLGAMMGVGWAIVLGDWLAGAAPLGVLLGLGSGGLIMLLVAACYAELGTALPRAGGDVVYAFELFGPAPAFVVGWFLVLMAAGMTSFEATSLAWFADVVLPGLQGEVLYRAFGHGIRGGALALGWTLVVVVGLTNYFGARSSSRLQDVFTGLKACAVVAFVAAAAREGSLANLVPLTEPRTAHSMWLGALWIAATAPVWYGGFQVIPQAVEERNTRTSLRRIGQITLATVAGGIVFYWLVVGAAAVAVPWRSLLDAPLPAAAAVRAAFSGGIGSTLVLGAIVLGILATWNACFIWASRLLLAMGRMQLAPAFFARTNRFGAPGPATIVVTGVGLVGVTLGRGGVLPIINMATIALAVSYVVSCWATLRLRQTQPELARPFRVAGGLPALRLAIGVSVAMAAVSVVEPLLRSRGMPLEWTLLLVWAAIGAAIWQINQRQRRRPAPDVPSEDLR